MRNKKIIILLLVVLVVPLVFFVAKDREVSMAETTGDRGTPVYAEQVIQDDINEYVSYSGKLIPKSELNIVSKIPGTIVEVKKDIGDVVKKGDIIARIDDRDIKNSIADINSQIKAAELSLDLHKSTYQTNKDLYDKNVLLYEAGAISKNDLDMLSTKLLKVDNQIKQTEVNIIRLNNSLKNLNNKLSDTVIKAPIDGVVNSRNAKVGEILSTNTVAFQIIDLSEVYVDVQVSQDNISKVKESKSINVSVDALAKDNFVGKFKYITPAADKQKLSYTARVSLDNSDNKLQPGMLCKVDFNVNSKEKALLVPIDAVVEKSAKKYVFLVKGSNAQMVEVQTGLENDGLIEIVGDLAQDDLVIVKGQNYLDHKEEINLIQEK